MMKRDLAAGQNTGRIACYIPTMDGGGVEKIALTLITTLAERGYPVDLVVTRKRGYCLNRVPDSVRVIELGKSSRVLGTLAAARAFPREAGLVLKSSVWHKHGLLQLRTLPPLAHYLRHAQPEVLLTRKWYCTVIGVWARALANSPCGLIGSVHNTISQRLATDRPAAFDTLMGRLLARADARIAVSDGVADDLAATIGISRQSIQTIYNPVVKGDSAKGLANRPDHPWLRLGEPPVIIAVGRLDPQKDYETLITAFARLRQRRSARLIILGEGNEHQAVAEYIAAEGLENDVDLPGWVDNPDDYMAYANLFVLSSRYEGLGNVLIEALACGTPIVSTDCPHGPREILSDGLYGRLVPVGDCDTLANGMEATLDDPGDREQRMRRASDFSVDRGVDQYQALIDSLLARRVSNQALPGT